MSALALSFYGHCEKQRDVAVQVLPEKKRLDRHNLQVRDDDGVANVTNIKGYCS